MNVSVFEPGTIPKGLARSLFRFRYDIQFRELGVKDEDIDATHGTLKDVLDPYAYQIVALDDGAIVGTGRVNIPRDDPPPPRLELLRLEELDADYRRSCAICSRLMIRPGYRNTWTTVDIFAHFFAIVRSQGCKWCVCLCRPESLNMFLRFGFEIHVANIEHPFLGERVAIKYNLQRKNLAQRSIERYIEEKARHIAIRDAMDGSREFEPARFELA